LILLPLQKLTGFPEHESREGVQSLVPGGR
jgi:hypothetical protein